MAWHHHTVSTQPPFSGAWATCGAARGTFRNARGHCSLCWESSCAQFLCFLVGTAAITHQSTSCCVPTCFSSTAAQTQVMLPTCFSSTAGGMATYVCMQRLHIEGTKSWGCESCGRRLYPGDTVTDAHGRSPLILAVGSTGTFFCKHYDHKAQCCTRFNDNDDEGMNTDEDCLADMIDSGHLREADVRRMQSDSCAYSSGSSEFDYWCRWFALTFYNLIRTYLFIWMSFNHSNRLFVAMKVAYRITSQSRFRQSRINSNANIHSHLHAPT